MPGIDLLIGLQANKLNAALAQVFRNPALSDKIFGGVQSGDFEGVPYTVSYKLHAAPVLELRSPTADEWNKSIKEGGNPGIPVANAFIVDLPSLNGSFESGGQTKQSDFAIKAICNASNNGGKPVLTAYSVVVDLSGLSPIDKFVTIQFLIPKILSAVNETLAGLTIPVPSFAGVSLTPPSVAIINGTLLIAFNMVNNAQPNLQGYPVPGNPFFVLGSQALVQAAANYVVTHNIQGQSFHKSGNEGSAGFSAGYNVNGTVNHVLVQTSGNPVMLHATVDLGLSASAGIDTPLGYIVQGGEVIWNGIKSAGEAVGNALNPTKW